ncbi:COMM domain-containing protein 2-like [Mya arenaria]|uniref:COMM domain-containing protein 2-like n=1 Tax=Mya arenaria TaxID=6604 RepID=UPI0022E77673|nr:COMM domain-containing protein 2-like [Mya arenaria]
MLLMFDEKHKKHLSFLVDIEIIVLQEFCRISLEFIKKGANSKIYESAAKKLGVPADTVQHGVEGLMYLLTESSKLLISEIDFQDSIMTLGFTEETRQELLQQYVDHRREIRSVLSEMAIDLPHYHNLEWRLDVQLASRSLRRQITPTVTMRLETKDGDKTSSQVLQTDPVNLVHLTRCLDDALQEMKSPYCRRIVRNIK